MLYNQLIAVPVIYNPSKKRLHHNEDNLQWEEHVDLKDLALHAVLGANNH
jgi:hypothetical protein